MCVILTVFSSISNGYELIQLYILRNYFYEQL